MERRTDVSLVETLDRLEADPELVVMVPFSALDFSVNLSLAEAGRFNVRIYSKGEMIARDDALDRDGVMVRMAATVALERRRILLLSRLLAVQTEKYLEKVARNRS